MVRLHKWQLNGLAGMCIAAVLSTGVLSLTSVHNNNALVNQINQAQRQACVSDNIQRAIQNKTNQASWKALKENLNYEVTQLAAQIQAVKKLGVSKKVLKAEIKQAHIQIHQDTQHLNTLTWTRLSDCSAPGRRNSTLQVAEISYQPMPASQRNVKNATKLTPTGSA